MGAHHPTGPTPGESGDTDQAVNALLAEAKEFAAAAEFFHAYDSYRRVLALRPESPEARYRAVLMLARCGATELACRQYRDLQVGDIDTLDARTLWARLLKDRALAAAASERASRIRAAAEAYAAADPSGAQSYPIVNAATLFLLAGDTAAANAHADLALTLLDREVPDTVEGAYWRAATRLEALLVKCDMTAAAAAVPDVVETLGRIERPSRQGREAMVGDLGALSSTVRQLRLIVQHHGLGEDLLASLPLPRAVHYCGHMVAPAGRPGRFPVSALPHVQEAIGRALDGHRIASAYGSLAAGADILIAEAVLARGAELHVILPFDAQEFVDISVAPSGEGWAGRFAACLERATTVRYATTDRYGGDDFLFGFASNYAMGLATLRAGFFGSPPLQIAVWDGVVTGAPAGTAHDVGVWRRLGHPQTIVAANGGTPVPPVPVAPRSPTGVPRKPVAMLFGDFKGFSKLADSDLPGFVTNVLARVATVLNPDTPGLLVLNTWGDGIFAVFEDTMQAAAVALDLHRRLAGVATDTAKSGVALRVGCHYGPAYPMQDPLTRRKNFFGAHVSTAARIEPVTPEGCVYVTETFAAELMMTAADRFSCQYVGMTEMAKGFGKLRMFLLSSRDDAGSKDLFEPGESRAY